MHIHFEKSINAQTDCTILSMSWMGKVPDDLPEQEEGWKLNRNHYYQEGWLATGNVRGILGVSYTTSHWKRPSGPGDFDLPARTNYNLRGHRSQVTLVQWNEPYQKLASCDSSGIIFVWIKFEGRWSIELINDRSTPVTHFSWSHDGRMALICYQDGFVLVGSVAGQRYWSTALNIEGTVTCGIWTPDDQQVLFGTSNGQIVVMDVHGTLLSQVQLPSDSPIASMSWSCEKFKMEENEDGEPTHYATTKRPFILGVCFTTGGIYLMKNYDDIAPIYIFTNLHGIHMEWGNSGEFLAIAGSRPVEILNESGEKVKQYSNHLHIYNQQGVRVLNLTVPFTKSPVTALTWGHNDKRIFVATGKVIHVGWVSKRIASLQLLCRLTIYKSLSTETCVSHLPLPLPVRALISSLHTQTIMSILPNMRELRDFVIHPPSYGRIYCTMIRHDDDSNQSPGTVYTLYVEFLGGLVPILKGKRTSKIRPEFVIFDPLAQIQSEGSGSHSQTTRDSITSSESCTTPTNNPTLSLGSGSSNLGYSDSSESDDVELCASPRMQRKRYRNRQRERERMLIREREREWERTRSSILQIPEPTQAQQLAYSDIFPESVRLVEVTSNIWGTKFKIHGLHSTLPDNLGSVTYKTSLLHLQPRQMTLLITELRDDIFLSPDSVHAHVDEEEEDFSVIVGNDSIHHHQYRESAGEIFHGQHVIYHPQGAGSPLITQNRCFLEPRSRTGSYTSGSSYPSSSSGIQASSSSSLVNNPGELSSDEDDVGYVELVLNTTRDCSTSTDPSTRTIPVQTQTVCQNCEDCPKIETEIAKVTNQINTLVTRAQIENVETPSSSSLSPCHGRKTSAEQSHRKASWMQHSNGESCNISSPSPVIQPTNAVPLHVRRSISTSFLEGQQVSLDLVNNEGLRDNSLPKRLVLVKRNQKGEVEPRISHPKPRLGQVGKSKSWDSCDISWWKKQKEKDAKGTTFACPNCNFPTSSNKTLSFQHDLKKIPPPTPAKSSLIRKSCNLGESSSSASSGHYHTMPHSNSTSRRSTGVGVPQTPARFGSRTRSRSHSQAPPEDRIERVPLNPTPARSSNSSPVSTPTTHRRSLSLLTPLLRRRDLKSRLTHQNGEKATTGTNPASSSFIPPGSPQHQPRSSPSTPATHRRTRSYLTSASSPLRQLFANSPLLSRRRNRNSNKNTQRNRNIIDSSDDESSHTEEPGTLTHRRNRQRNPTDSPVHSSRSPRSSVISCGSSGTPFKDLETFQKHQLRQKLRNKKIHDVEENLPFPRRREFLLRNKAPVWNETSQVYQLDFGGRVTQESAKNFQIEFRGKQVMQFGRIDGNAYTLDFQYPFSGVQAFAVALANVTQRLK